MNLIWSQKSERQKGRGAAGKTPVFRLLKRDGRVYVEIVKTALNLF
jgi:hypothetical protein